MTGDSRKIFTEISIVFRGTFTSNINIHTIAIGDRHMVVVVGTNFREYTLVFLREKIVTKIAISFLNGD